MSWNKIWNNRKIDKNNLYDHNGYSFKSNIEYIKFIKEITSNIIIPNNSKILDIGCGNGSFTNEMLKMKNIDNTNIFGLDFCKENIKHANKNYNGTYILHDIANKLPFENNYFNVILCVSSLFYLKNLDQLDNVIKEIKRVSKKNCLIFFGNCMDEEKKDIANEIRKETHHKESKHLYINKKYFIDKFSNNYINIIDNDDLDLEFYNGRKYKYNVYITKNNINVVDVDSLIYMEEVNIEKVLSLKESLKKTKILKNPITVDKNLKIVINGHHRLSALKMLGIKKVPIFHVNYNDVNLKYNKNSTYKNKSEILSLLKNNILPLEYKSCLHMYMNSNISDIESKKNININLKNLKTKVITFGVFDLLHLGHINLIQKLKNYGNYVIIAVHKTEDVIKTKRNPINSLDIRIRSIKALKNVDDVISYSDVYESIQEIDFYIWRRTKY